MTEDQLEYEERMRNTSSAPEGAADVEALLTELEDATAAFERARIKGDPMPFVRLQDAQVAVRAAVAALREKCDFFRRDRDNLLKAVTALWESLGDLTRDKEKQDG